MSVSYSQNFDLRADLQDALGGVSEEMELMLQEVSEKAESTIRARGHVYRGNLASGIGYDPVKEVGGVLTGVAGPLKTKGPHGWVLEAGMLPGKWRPIEPLKRWAERKFGGTDREVNRIAYGTRKKLFEQGTPGARYMRDAFALVRGDVAKRIADAAIRGMN